MSYPNGVRVKVFVFILDENNAVEDSRERLLNKCRPDTVLKGTKLQVSKELVRQLIDRGFFGLRPIDWLSGVTKAVFSKDVDMQASFSFRKVLSEELEKTIPIVIQTDKQFENKFKEQKTKKLPLSIAET